MSKSSEIADKIPFLDLAAQHAELKEEFVRVFERALESSAFAGGPMTAAFESEYAEYTGTCFAAGVGSGTDALRFALLAMGIGPGCRVATVPNTFIATTEAISQAGAEIDFVDIDPETSLMDPNRLADFLKARFDDAPKEKRPAAIIPVHLYGQCADMDPIMELARRYELKVLEDAAQAHGAEYKGKKAGTLADAAAFSFYPGKNLGAFGEAGAVTTNDPAIDEKVRVLRDHGQKSRYRHVVEGYNGRMDGIQAGVLSVKLKYLDKWNAARRKAADFLDGEFEKVEEIRPVKILPFNITNRHLYVIQAPNRDRLAARLAEKGIATGMHYPVPLHLQECYSNLGFSEGDFPNAERAARELLSLPMFPTLSEEQIVRIVEVVKASV